MQSFEPDAFRAQFPLLTPEAAKKNLIYFDSAATSQKPRQVIEAQSRFYLQQNANVHRASHALSSIATAAFEQARVRVQRFINAPSPQQVIWTKGATEAINLVAQSWGRSFLLPGDEILLTQGEHHANIVPWQLVAEQTGAVIKVVSLNALGIVDIGALEQQLSERTKLVACHHVSNVLGRINPMTEIISRAKACGAITLIDGAQAVAHLPVDVQALDCDFYVFSAHKMYGPTGVGVLYGKTALLEQMPPYQGGGEMIERVSFSGTTFNALPFKFEAGTPNISGIVAFAEAIAFIERYGFAALAQYEQQLLQYCHQRLSACAGVTFVADGLPDIPLLSFTVKGQHNHDLAATLDAKGIAVRSGHHCAMPLMAYLGLNGCLRVSLAPYNTKAEIDYFIECLQAMTGADSYQAEPPVANSDSDRTSVSELLSLFQRAKGWDGRHREIMLLARQLPATDAALRCDDNLIHGCESQAWLDYRRHEDGRLSFYADSDAKVIRGLLVIILAAFNQRNAREILTFDIDGYFQQLGLLQHLSPSRGNGVKAIVARILAIAEQQLSA